MFVLLFTCFANIKGLSKVQVVMYYDTAFSTCLHYKETKTVSFELQMLMASPKVLILSVFDFSASISLTHLQTQVYLELTAKDL